MSADMDTKTCSDCGATKNLDEFYRHPQMADGRLGSCKECRLRYAKQRRQEKMQDPEWVAAEAERSRQKALRQYSERKRDPAYRSRQREANARWRERNPEKRRAHDAVSNAIRDGKLERKTECEECGEGGRLHRHHEDYSKPLEVEWLCPRCHGRRHRKA
jgi:ribosomal protein S27AE